MAMHPIDANVIYDVSGNEIFLYDCGKENIDLIPNRLHGNRLNYDLYEFWWKGLIHIGVGRLKRAIRSRLKK